LVRSDTTLPSSTSITSSPKDDSLRTTLSFYAHVAYEDAYVQPFILAALQTQLEPGSHALLPAPPRAVYLDAAKGKYLQITPYESLPHETLLSSPLTHYANAYTIRKALIRKHYLAHTVHAWVAKNPQSLLKTHVPQTLDFELDYAEFLDDALVDAWEVRESWERNRGRASGEREWWILKPSMSDKGQGIRLFSSEDELREIFEIWEEENPEEDGDNDDNEGQDVERKGHEEESNGDKGLMTSHLRHFIMQPYIAPLLIPELGKRKFHIRSYVLSVGALSVYVYEDMLALFAGLPYTHPGSDSGNEDRNPNVDLRPHLTNTVLQTSSELPNQPQSQLVYPLSSLPKTHLPPWSPANALSQILPLTGALFRAAAAQPTNFQPLPNCFEVFGIDWLVDDAGKVWLLEVNAFPDFAQTGSELGERVVGGFWQGVVAVTADKWFGSSVLKAKEKREDPEVDGIKTWREEVKREAANGDDGNVKFIGHGMWKVLDIDLGRG
jgi:tubulin---tyrosine ligase